MKLNDQWVPPFPMKPVTGSTVHCVCNLVFFESFSELCSAFAWRQLEPSKFDFQHNNLCTVPETLYCLSTLIITKLPAQCEELKSSLLTSSLYAASVDDLAGSPWRSIALLSFRDHDKVAHPCCSWWIYYKVISSAFPLHWLSMSSVQSSV